VVRATPPVFAQEDDGEAFVEGHLEDEAIEAHKSREDRCVGRGGREGGREKDGVSKGRHLSRDI